MMSCINFPATSSTRSSPKY